MKKVALVITLHQILFQIQVNSVLGLWEKAPYIRLYPFQAFAYVPVSKIVSSLQMNCLSCCPAFRLFLKLYDQVGWTAVPLLTRALKWHQHNGCKCFPCQLDYLPVSVPLTWWLVVLPWAGWGKACVNPADYQSSSPHPSPWHTCTLTHKSYV